MGNFRGLEAPLVGMRETFGEMTLIDSGPHLLRRLLPAEVAMTVKDNFIELVRHESAFSLYCPGWRRPALIPIVGIELWSFAHLTPERTTELRDRRVIGGRNRRF